MTARITLSIFSLDHTGVGIKKEMTKCAADSSFFMIKWVVPSKPIPGNSEQVFFRNPWFYGRFVSIFY